MQEFGSLKSFLSYLGPQLSGISILCFLLPSLLSGCTIGVAAAADRLLDDRHPVSILSSLRASCQGGCNAMAWWLQILCLLMWQATFFIRTPPISFAAPRRAVSSGVKKELGRGRGGGAGRVCLHGYAEPEQNIIHRTDYGSLKRCHSSSQW